MIKICISVTSHALDPSPCQKLSHLLGPPPPSSVMSFIDGPNVYPKFRFFTPPPWAAPGGGRPPLSPRYATNLVAAPVRCSWQRIDRSLVAPARAVTMSSL